MEGSRRGIVGPAPAQSAGDREASPLRDLLARGYLSAGARGGITDIMQAGADDTRAARRLRDRETRGL